MCSSGIPPTSAAAAAEVGQANHSGPITRSFLQSLFPTRQRCALAIIEPFAAARCCLCSESIVLLLETCGFYYFVSGMDDGKCKIRNISFSGSKQVLDVSKINCCVGGRSSILRSWRGRPRVYFGSKINACSCAVGPPAKELEDQQHECKDIFQYFLAKRLRLPFLVTFLDLGFSLLILLLVTTKRKAIIKRLFQLGCCCCQHSA